MQSSPTKGISVVQTWSGRLARTHFTYAIPQNGSYTFSWAFQKQSWNQDDQQPQDASGFSTLSAGIQRMRLFDMDSARIESINVTGTVEGGASVCLPCAQGLSADASGCIPCPPGHYTDQGSTYSAPTCKACPPGTVVPDPSSAVGPSACVRCGPALVGSADGRMCTTDCTPTVNNTLYDLRKIGRFRHFGN